MQIEVAWTKVVADYAHAIGISSYPASEQGLQPQRAEGSVVDTREVVAITFSAAPDGRGELGRPTYLARVTFVMRGSPEEGPFLAFMATGLPSLEAADRLAHLQATKLARECGLLGYLDKRRGPWPTSDHDVLVREIEAELAALASQTQTRGGEA